mmetsp:Transcript_90561/g.198458  ORF Transcript_90561/g.198458 Transcript_90561/m.198458 type:complete len:895 (-) Transcript_90561:128-2812(-)|eukprot:CAMPEP_0206562356 /NCGR_PEP_ID=MMETSP0325_2-20121206/22184_1 /ASSEMBLY_ACC=CAM_ASM_000347 /TAXON_ID=2866 /ORGANISM="Crypthecodinium cohnii, Strain Seligo" /LENGTH=894 /DNA_ID=CAMNT_0054064519 /DNA_START=12 /DNA_END=2696 /DNA_ORIENTATION=-
MADDGASVESPPATPAPAQSPAAAPAPGASQKVETLEEALLHQGVFALRAALGDGKLTEISKHMLKPGMFEKLFSNTGIEIIDFADDDVRGAVPDIRHLNLAQVLFIRCQALNGGTAKSLGMTMFFKMLVTAVPTTLVEHLKTNSPGVTIERPEEVARLVLCIYGVQSKHLSMERCPGHWLLRCGSLEAVLDLERFSLTPAASFNGPVLAYHNQSRANASAVDASKRKVNWLVKLYNSPSEYQDIAPEPRRVPKSAAAGATRSFNQRVADAKTARSAMEREGSLDRNQVSPARLEELETELEAAKKEATALKESLSESSAKVASLEGTLKDSQTAQAAAQKDLAEAKSLLEAAESSQKALQEELVASQSKASQLEEELAAAKLSREAKEKSSEEELQELRAQKEQAEEELKTTKAKGSEELQAAQQLAEAAQAKSELQTTLCTATEAKRQLLEQQVQALEAQMASLQVELGEAKEASTAAAAKQQEQEKELHSQLEQSKQRVQELEKEMEKVKEESQSDKEQSEQHAKLEAELAALQKQFKDTEKQKEELTIANASLREQLQNAESANKSDDLSGQILKLQEEQAQSEAKQKEELRQLETLLEEAQTKAKETEQRFAAEREKVESMAAMGEELERLRTAQAGHASEMAKMVAKVQEAERAAVVAAEKALQPQQSKVSTAATATVSFSPPSRTEECKSDAVEGKGKGNDEDKKQAGEEEHIEAKQATAHDLEEDTLPRETDDGRRLWTARTGSTNLGTPPGTPPLQKEDQVLEEEEEEVGGIEQREQREDQPVRTVQQGEEVKKPEQQAKKRPEQPATAGAAAQLAAMEKAAMEGLLLGPGLAPAGKPTAKEDVAGVTPPGTPREHDDDDAASYASARSDADPTEGKPSALPVPP